jgi:hypothetical protein
MTVPTRILSFGLLLSTLLVLAAAVEPCSWTAENEAQLAAGADIVFTDCQRGTQTIIRIRSLLAADTDVDVTEPLYVADRLDVFPGLPPYEVHPSRHPHLWSTEFVRCLRDPAVEVLFDRASAAQHWPPDLMSNGVHTAAPACTVGMQFCRVPRRVTKPDGKDPIDLINAVFTVNYPNIDKMRKGAAKSLVKQADIRLGLRRETILLLRTVLPYAKATTDQNDRRDPGANCGRSKSRVCCTCCCRSGATGARRSGASRRRGALSRREGGDRSCSSA